MAAVNVTPDTTVQPNDRKAHDDAVAGIEDDRLASLLAEHWLWFLSRNPMFASLLGYSGYDELVEDNSKQARSAHFESLELFLDRARALSPAELSSADEENLELFIHSIEGELGERGCHFELWNVSPARNPIVRWNRMASTRRIQSLTDGENFLKLAKRIARHVRNETAALRHGVQGGWRANAESARRARKLVREALAKQIREWPLVSEPEAAASAWSQAEREDFSESLRRIVREEVLPEFHAYESFLTTAVIPMARDGENGGLSGLPAATDCYRSLLRQHTSLDVDPVEVRELGLREMERVSRDIRALGQRAFGIDEIPSILNKLRSDQGLYYKSSEAILVEATKLTELAERSLGKHFRKVDFQLLKIEPVPAHEASFSALGRYRPARGTNAAVFFVNTHDPGSRARFLLPALVAHEAIPGHHLQASAASKGEVPAFRRHTYFVAYIEGWGLYAEALAGEIGLYHSDLARIGSLMFDAWRVARLVVDTGIHAFGWTRPQARAYLRQHTALTDEDIDSEVERYVSQPAQAVAYKLGELEFTKLRQSAKKRLGGRFDIRDFHAAALEFGPTTLKLLAKRVDNYVKSELD